jgi:hypothetical protein
VYDGVNSFLSTSTLAYITVVRLGFTENKAELVGESVLYLIDQALLRFRASCSTRQASYCGTFSRCDSQVSRHVWAILFMGHPSRLIFPSDDMGSGDAREGMNGEEEGGLGEAAVGSLAAVACIG